MQRRIRCRGRPCASHGLCFSLALSCVADAAHHDQPLQPGSSTSSPPHRNTQPDGTPSVSAAFPRSEGGSTDLSFLSSDDCLFYVHSQYILPRSQNGWDALINNTPPSWSVSGSVPTVILLPESSDVLSVVLHTVYSKPCSYLNPSNHTLISAIEVLVKYGIHLRQSIAPNTPLYALLLERSRSSPLLFFTLAAQYDLYELAAPISSLLLTYDIKDIPDEYALKMGPRYLKRLVLLRYHRLSMLKRLITPPPDGHAPTGTCGLQEQKILTGSWAFTTALFVLEAGPGGSLGQ